MNDRAAHEGVANDRIFVTGLALHAYHGVMPHEAKVGQSFALDLAADIDLAEAGRSDKVADTVRVTVHKPHAPIAATFRDVGVEIFRSRHG